MGWNSWDCYGTTVTEEEVLANAAYMAKNLKSYGWQYVVIDIQWSDPNAKAHGYRPDSALAMDPNGRLIPAANRFPSSAGGLGFKPLADRIHTLGPRLPPRPRARQGPDRPPHPRRKSVPLFRRRPRLQAARRPHPRSRPALRHPHHARHSAPRRRRQPARRRQPGPRRRDRRHPLNLPLELRHVRPRYVPPRRAGLLRFPSSSLRFLGRRLHQGRRHRAPRAPRGNRRAALRHSKDRTPHRAQPDRKSVAQG